MGLLGSIHKKLRGSSIVYLYFVQEGAMYKAFHSVCYPFFGRYLNLPGHQFSSLRPLFSIAWSLKIFFSFFSDSIPILGYRRIPYITLGLSAIMAALLAIALKPMPQPYYYTAFDKNESQCYVMNGEDDSIRNANAPNEAFVYVVLFFLWYAGLSCADASVDGLMTQRSKLEEESVRGTLISHTRISSVIGSILVLILTGILMNSAEYGGSFCFGLGLNQMSIFLLMIAASGVVYAFIYTNEKDVDVHEDKIVIKEKLNAIWTLLHQWNYLKLLIFCLIISMQWSMRTPAGIKVQAIWVGVEPIVANLFQLISLVVSGLGMIIYMKFFKQFNWRTLLVLQTIFVQITEGPVLLMTIFDVFRNQYFWFVDDVIDSITRFWFIFIMELVVVEFAPNGIEGISYALIWAVCNIGRAIGTALANFIMSPLCLTDNYRYQRDSSDDRMAVFISYAFGYVIQLLTLFALFLIPNQKSQAQEWRQKGNSKDNRKSWNAAIFVTLGLIGLIGSTIVIIFTQFEETRCLMIAGGPGCNKDPNVSPVQNCLLYPDDSTS